MELCKRKLARGLVFVHQVKNKMTKCAKRRFFELHSTS